MISNIKKFFEKNLHLDSNASVADKSARLPLATAALMFELLKTDQVVDEREIETLLQVLRRTFNLDEKKLREIIALAEGEAKRATSLYEFTSLINADYGYAERVKLVESLWEVAYADQHLDRYEDHLVRKVADLIHVRHSDFIRTKLEVKSRLEISANSNLQNSSKSS
jgi:uncharacterized tellurite resistance protein B-like protein